MRILITGIDGQLGSEIYNISEYETYGTYLIQPDNLDKNMFKLDIVERNDVFSIIQKIKSDWVIHCAAITDMELCEENKDLAWKSNVDGTKNIVDACLKFNSKLVFISTDYVFDGAKGFYKEDDIPNPINFYGKTKLIGEWLVKWLPDHIIIRTSMLFSHKKGKFFRWVLEGITKGELYGMSDVYSSPTLASELAECVISLIKKDVRGVYHAAGDERISRYNLIREFVTAFGHDPNIVKPIKSSELKLKAYRIPDSSLDISKIKGLGIKFSDINGALDKIKKVLESS